MRYTTDEINTLTEDQVWRDLPKGLHTVVFQDGELLLSDRHIMLNHTYWILVRKYPGLLLRKEHSVPNNFTAATHESLGSRLYWDVYNAAKSPLPGMVWVLNKTFYGITNTLYNRYCSDMSEYVTSSSLEDLNEVLNHPIILEAKKICEETIASLPEDSSKISEAIDTVHKVVLDLLYEDNGIMTYNGLKLQCRSGILNKGQLLQLIGPRGFLHDIDGSVFKYPIMPGYAETFKTLYDSAVESRSSARAILANDAPLKESEYYNREMQLLASALHSVKDTTCVGFKTFQYKVKEGDERLLRGKYHMVNNQPVMIWNDIEPLIDKYISIRSITGCNNVDSQTTCETCLGWAHRVIPPGTNVGYALTTELCAIITQLILSTKHLEISAAAKELDIRGKDKDFIRLHKDNPGSIFLTRDAAKRNPIIRLDIEYVRGLNDILTVDIDNLSPSRTSKCKEMSIVPTDKQGNPIGFPNEVRLEVSGTGSSLTVDMLRYLKEHKWSATKKYIEFRLVDWDYKTPIFTSPNKGDNVQLFLREVKRFMLPEKSDVKITQFHTPAGAISELLAILETRIKVNMIQVEIFVRGCMCKDPSRDNYTLPRANDSFKFVGVKNCLFKRSLTGLLAYQEQAKHVMDPRWFKKNLPGTKHLLDPIIE